MANIDLLKRLHDVLAECAREDSTGFLVNFSSKNYQLTQEEFVEKYIREENDRAQAKAIRLKALQEIAQKLGDYSQEELNNNNITVNILGVQGDTGVSGVVGQGV